MSGAILFFVGEYVTLTNVWSQLLCLKYDYMYFSVKEISFTCIFSLYFYKCNYALTPQGGVLLGVSYTVVKMCLRIYCGIYGSTGVMCVSLFTCYLHREPRE